MRSDAIKRFSQSSSSAALTTRPPAVPVSGIISVQVDARFPTYLVYLFSLSDKKDARRKMHTPDAQTSCCWMHGYEQWLAKCARGIKLKIYKEKTLLPFLTYGQQFDRQTAAMISSIRTSALRLAVHINIVSVYPMCRRSECLRL